MSRERTLAFDDASSLDSHRIVRGQDDLRPGQCTARVVHDHFTRTHVYVHAGRGLLAHAADQQAVRSQLVQSGRGQLHAPGCRTCRIYDIETGTVQVDH